MRTKLRRLAELSVRDWLLLPQLVLAAILLDATLRLLPLPRLVRRLSSLAARPWLAAFPLGHRAGPTEGLAPLADLAAGFARRDGRCLPRALLLYWLLRARRRPARLLVGVARERAALRAHAWVEADGLPFDETATAALAFRPLVRL